MGHNNVGNQKISFIGFLKSFWGCGGVGWEGGGGFNSFIWSHKLYIALMLVCHRIPLLSDILEQCHALLGRSVTVWSGFVLYWLTLEDCIN